MRNFGSNSATQLTSVPIRIGYSQSLVGYNSFKWERRIEPLKYERVKKEFLYNVEKVSETATNYFFSLAMAQAEYNLAKEKTWLLRIHCIVLGNSVTELQLSHRLIC